MGGLYTFTQRIEWKTKCGGMSGTNRKENAANKKKMANKNIDELRCGKLCSSPCPSNTLELPSTVYLSTYTYGAYRE